MFFLPNDEDSVIYIIHDDFYSDTIFCLCH